MGCVGGSNLLGLHRYVKPLIAQNPSFAQFFFFLAIGNVLFFWSKESN